MNPGIGIGSLMCYLPPIAAPKTHQRKVYKDIFLPRMATFDQKNSVFHLLKMKFIYDSEFVAQQNVIKSFCLKLGQFPREFD